MLNALSVDFVSCAAFSSFMQRFHGLSWGDAVRMYEHDSERYDTKLGEFYMSMANDYGVSAIYVNFVNTMGESRFFQYDPRYHEWIENLATLELERAANMDYASGEQRVFDTIVEA